VGNSYQITSKLVNSETGEIIASEINEVPVKVFDEDAERYLVLVPEYQAIGIYLVGGYAPATVKKLIPVTVSGYKLTPANPSAFFGPSRGASRSMARGISDQTEGRLGACRGGHG
jgi:hypothetical protein